MSDTGLQGFIDGYRARTLRLRRAGAVGRSLAEWSYGWNNTPIPAVYIPPTDRDFRDMYLNDNLQKDIFVPTRGCVSLGDDTTMP